MPLTVYPNPNAGKFYIELNSPKSTTTSVELFNVSGELVHKCVIEWNKTKLIDLEHAQPGNYTLRLKNNKVDIRQQVLIENSNPPQEHSTMVSIEIEVPSLN